jgi:hypothetical protein
MDDETQRGHHRLQREGGPEQHGRCNRHGERYQSGLLKILAARKETDTVSAKRLSIGQMMMVIALVAVNLAVILPVLEIDIFPQVWVVLLGSLDFLFIWKLLRRPFRAFPYVFLFAFVIGFFVMAALAATERIHPLGLLVRWYQYLTGEKTNSIALAGFLRVGEIWMALFLSFTLACAVSLLAAWLERRRGWDIAAFFRGSFIGFGIAYLLIMIDDAVWGWEDEPRARVMGRLVLLGICLILGGLFGLSKLKSSTVG